MSGRRVQVQKTAAGTWSVTELTELRLRGATGWDYQLLGRVVQEGKLYYAERVQWRDDGTAYRREPGAGHLMIDRAVEALLDEGRRPS